MFKSSHLIRKALSVGIAAVIGFTAIGLGNAGTASAATKVDKIISTGKKYLGVKYRFGAPAGVTYAFDCSSFTQYIFKKNGVYLPRVSSAQATRGKKVYKSHLKKGDLVFFKRPGKSGVGHVAVYAGNNLLLHASGRQVKYSSLGSSYWQRNYITARRLV